ncbi:MAG: hypothetical protein Q9218_007813 [Villophora microphyllina]
MPTELEEPIAKNALTILVNISTDPEILESLAEDDAFLESILSRTTVPPPALPLQLSLKHPEAHT